MDEDQVNLTEHILEAPLHDDPSQTGNQNLRVFEDGSAVLEDMLPAHRGEMNPQQHNQNLAEILPDTFISQLGHDLIFSIEEDMESQKEYYEMVGVLIDLLGIKPSSTTDEEALPYEGAPTLHSMALFNSCMDMLATLVNYLYPATGVATTTVIGSSNPELEDRAFRAKSWMNFYFDRVAKEFKKEGKRAWFWSLLLGSIYKKVYIDPVLGRPTSIFIRPQDFVVNAEYSTHITAPRKTHIVNMTSQDFFKRVAQGIYVNVDEAQPTDRDEPDANAIEQSLSDISGRTDLNNSDDEFYKFYECYVDWHIPDDPHSVGDMPLPYVITIESESQRVLSIQRNWLQDDPSKKAIERFVNYSFFPALEGEGYGMLQYAGKSAHAATVITRMLINTATYANFPAFLYQQGLRLENNNLNPAPGEGWPIPCSGQKLSDVIMTLPYKEPSPALKELLVAIEDNISRPSELVNKRIADMAGDAHHLSVLAMLKSLQKVPNMVLQNYFESFSQELDLFKNCFAEWMVPFQPYPFVMPGGESQVFREDFAENILIVPAADPSPDSDTYKIVQSQIVMDNANQAPDLHNRRAVYVQVYKNMGIPHDQIEQILVPEQNLQPFTGDPITENQHLMTGKPITANIMQDHQAHMTVHAAIMNDPNSTQAQIAAAMAHNQEHRSWEFLIQMQQQIGFEMPQDPAQIPPEMQNQIAQAAAQVISQQQQAQQEATPQPLDPGQVELEAIHETAKSAKEKHDIERLRIAFDEHKLEVETKLQEAKLELENKKIELDHALKMNAQQLTQMHKMNGSAFGG